VSTAEQRMSGPGDAVGQLLPDRCRAGQQAFALDGVKHGERRRARDRVPAERAAVVPLTQRRARRAEPDARPDRQPAAESLGEREHVRHDARGLAGEPGTGTPDPALDLIDHQQRACGVAGLPRAPQVAGWRRHHPRLPLAGLEDDGGTLAGDG